MAIKTTGRSIKKVGELAVENSDRLWKASRQPFVKRLQSFLSHRLAGGSSFVAELNQLRAESGKLGNFSLYERSTAGHLALVLNTPRWGWLFHVEQRI
jgi:hypothetical protein